MAKNRDRKSEDAYARMGLARPMPPAPASPESPDPTSDDQETPPGPTPGTDPPAGDEAPASAPHPDPAADPAADPRPDPFDPGHFTLPGMVPVPHYSALVAGTPLADVAARPDADPLHARCLAFLDRLLAGGLLSPYALQAADEAADLAAALRKAVSA